MRIRFVLAVLALMSLSFLAPSAVADSGAVLGVACPDLGATTMAADHTAILLSAFSAPNAATNCSLGGGCVWKQMSGGGGGASFTYYCYFHDYQGTPLCTDHGGAQGHCPSAGELMSGGLSGLKEKAYLGNWGSCTNTTWRGGYGYDYPWPSGTICGSQADHPFVMGDAYVCSQ